MLIEQIIGGVGVGILALRLLSTLREIVDSVSNKVTSGFDLKDPRR
jgi:hypothetical protein